MDHLHRELAPITAAGWAEIEAEASQTLKRMLAGRKLVDFEGPHGWEHAAVNLGRVEDLSGAPVGGARMQRRVVQPMVEARVPFAVERDELEAAARGAPDIDMAPVTEAARKVALLEDSAVFNGYGAAGITGIMQTQDNQPLVIDEDYMHYPALVAQASDQLRRAGVDGPYAIALG